MSVRVVRHTITLVLVCFILAGCWDYRDLETRALVLGLGIESDPNSTDPRFLVTAEIARPAVTRGDSQSRGVGGAQHPKVLVSEVGTNAAQAMLRLNQKLSLVPSWGQLVVVAVSDEVARDGINHIFDIFLRSVRLNSRARMFIVDGSPKELFAFQSPMQPVTARFLRQVENQFSESPRFAKPEDIYTVKRPVGEGATLVPRVTLASDEILVSGSAVITEQGMVGWLDEEETAGANWIIGAVNWSSLFVDCPNNEDGTVSMVLHSQGRRIRLHDDESPIRFHVTFSAGAQVLDLANCLAGPMSSQVREQIETEANAVLTRRAMDAITRAQQELRTDFLHFGVYLQRNRPELWRELDWKQAFPDVSITVESKITITDPGSINREAKI